MIFLIFFMSVQNIGKEYYNDDKLDNYYKYYYEEDNKIKEEYHNDKLNCIKYYNNQNNLIKAEHYTNKLNCIKFIIIKII